MRVYLLINISLFLIIHPPIFLIELGGFLLCLLFVVWSGLPPVADNPQPLFYGENKFVLYGGIVYLCKKISYEKYTFDSDR